MKKAVFQKIFSEFFEYNSFTRKKTRIKIEIMDDL